MYVDSSPLASSNNLSTVALRQSEPNSLAGENGLGGTGHHPYCYFSGGHVVLLVSLGSKSPVLFRVQRAVLMHSEIFQHMFDIPPSSSNAIEGSTDDNPIKLEDDPEHFAGVLSVYYGSILAPIPQNSGTPFVIGVLRVASKYEFIQAREWALQKLRVDWSFATMQVSDSLTNIQEGTVSDATEVIRVSHDLKINEFLGPALYLLCVAQRNPWSSGLYSSLSLEDAVRLLQGTRHFYQSWGAQEASPQNKFWNGPAGWLRFVTSRNTINAVLTGMALQPIP